MNKIDWKTRVFLSALVICSAVILSNPIFADAKASSSRCLIKVDGIIYDTDPCNFYDEDRNILKIGKDIGDGGYWAYILKENGGLVGSVSWSGEAGARHAHNSLGIMKRDGDCWVNERARICRNLPSEEPYYYIENRGPTPADSKLFAYWGGREYIVNHPSWEGVFPYKVAEKVDLDGDGNNDQIILFSSGGNCCAPYFSVLKAIDGWLIDVTNEELISAGWGGYSIVDNGEKKHILVRDSLVGAGNTDDGEWLERYALEDGSIKLIRKSKNGAEPSYLISLSATELARDDDQSAIIRYNLDLDQTEDTIACSYWERWGSMSCEIHFSADDVTIKKVCKEVGIAPMVEKNLPLLSCDGELMRWSPN